MSDTYNNIYNSEENAVQEKENVINLINNFSSDFKNIFNETNHRENYYYDLAKKMLEIYDELYQSYYQSLSEENDKIVDYNWKEKFPKKFRENVLNKLINTIYPYDNENMKNDISKGLKKYLFKIEKDIFYTAKTKSNYYKNLHHKIFKIQNELRNCSLFYSDFGKPETEKINFNWKKEIQMEYRKYLRYKLVKAIYPNDVKNLPIDILNDFKEYAYATENKIFKDANCKKKYFHDLSEKIFEIQYNFCENSTNYLNKVKKNNGNFNVNFKGKSENIVKSSPYKLMNSYSNSEDNEKSLSEDKNQINKLANYEKNKSLNITEKLNVFQSEDSKIILECLNELNAVSFSNKFASSKIRQNSTEKANSGIEKVFDKKNNKYEKDIVNDCQNTKIANCIIEENSSKGMYGKLMHELMKNILTTIMLEIQDLVF